MTAMLVFNDSFRQLTDVLDAERERHCREAMEEAKKGNPLPALRPLREICANKVTFASAQALGRVKECNEHHEAKRQRLMDAVHALGVIEPLSARGPPPPTPTRLATPSKPSSARPKQPPATPTGATEKKKKMAPPSAKKTPSGLSARGARSDLPVTPRAEAAPCASRHITREQWDQKMTRYLMAGNQMKHDVGKDYVMPPPNAIFKAQRSKYAQARPHVTVHARHV
eukprot:Rhum_TRINITY_DN11212_c0_g1::Rhum_TRINITY_DN11212_c0_g1_i2::g.43318::m.43318